MTRSTGWRGGSACSNGDRELRSIQQVGVPVVQWRGPGSLDQVLRDLSRHAAKPRMVRR